MRPKGSTRLSMDGFPVPGPHCWLFGLLLLAAQWECCQGLWVVLKGLLLAGAVPERLGGPQWSSLGRLVGMLRVGMLPGSSLGRLEGMLPGCFSLLVLVLFRAL